MSEHADNLQRAARLIRRMAEIRGGPDEFEGVRLTDIAVDCVLAAHAERVRELADRFARPAPASDNVIPIDTFSRKVGA